MKLRKYRWSKHYESAEVELVEQLAEKNITARRWVLEDDEVVAPTATSADSWLWCVDGSIVFTIDGKRISLQAGDTLEVPADTTYEAVAGIFGCVCHVKP
jgi:quercetin dioxygenase-like cupin family protein